MLHQLSELEPVWGPFRLFDYLSVRMILAFVTALVLGLCLSGPVLRQLARLRQPERDARLMGELAKQGGQVPTMGGLLIAAAMLPSVLLWVRFNLLVASALVALVGMGAIGWYDDWLKVRHGNADGVSARAKLAGQFAVAALAFALLLLDADTSVYCSIKAFPWIFKPKPQGPYELQVLIPLSCQNSVMFHVHSPEGKAL